jgi:hypothetical protein
MHVLLCVQNRSGHLGWVFLNYTATWRGFDTFFGTRGNTNNCEYVVRLTEYRTELLTSLSASQRFVCTLLTGRVS